MSKRSEIRSKVAKSYCRSIAVIDDEVFEPRGSVTLSSRFNSVRRSCQDEGIVCHLFDYPMNPNDIEADRVNKAAVKLALGADVVVLDWALGLADNPENSRAILKLLARDKGFRFVVIYTNKALVRVERVLRNVEELARLKPVGGDWEPLEELKAGEGAEAEGEGELNLADLDEGGAQDSTEVAGEEEVHREAATEAAEPVEAAGFAPRFYHLDHRLFLSVQAKPADPLESAQLVGSIRAALLQSFPDDLHWSGLEMAARVREWFPKVLATLPVGTDKGLQFQSLYQRDGDVADQVAEVLLDELRLALRSDRLQSVSDALLFDEIKGGMQALGESDRLSEIAHKASCAARSLIGLDNAQQEPRAVDPAAFAAVWNNPRLNQAREALQSFKGTGDYFPNSLEEDESRVVYRVVSTYLGAGEEGDSCQRPCEKWASVRESALLKVQRPIETGHIIEDLAKPDALDRWRLCISPLCDCAHPKDGYLVVVGEELPTSRPSAQPETQSSVVVRSSEQPDATTRECQIAWDARRVQFIPKDALEDKEKYKLAGIVRSTFVSRVVHRVFAWQSRVGVDTSEFVRRVRNE